MVLHAQLLYVSEAVGIRRFRREAQNEQASARRDHLVRVYHRYAFDVLVEGVCGSPFGLLLVLTDEGCIASVLSWKNLASS